MNDWLQVLSQYQYLGLLALVATVFLTPVAMHVAHRFGVLDMPDKVLKPHARPTPYLGGTAICVAWAFALVAAMVSGVVRDWYTMLVLLLGGVAMSVLGLVDDVRHLRPKTRLAVGTAVIGATLLLTGVGFHLVDSFLAGVEDLMAIELPAMPWLTVPVSVVISLILVLGACNSTNLIDGLDGLCTGVTAIISFGFFLLAAHLAAGNFSPEGDPIRLTLAIGMFGAAIGFLPWNFNPARIFMGDAGSVLLGYNCGILILLFAERSGIARWVLGALMIFALPVFDTALAMFRRWSAGRSIFEGDRSHFYDQLVQRGLSIRQTVAVCYVLTLAYAGIGLLLTWVHGVPPRSVIRTRYAILLYLCVCLVTGLLAWYMGLTHPEERKARNGAKS